MTKIESITDAATEAICPARAVAVQAVFGDNDDACRISESTKAHDLTLFTLVMIGVSRSLKGDLFDYH